LLASWAATHDFDTNHRADIAAAPAPLNDY
jgi:hypothetical protein